MPLTLRQARRKLSKFENAFGVTDVRDAINDAIDSLSGLAPWECLRRVVRFISATPEFALPQGYAGLVRVCVNGRPSPLKSQDFSFLPGSPGDFKSPVFRHVPLGAGGVVDLGYSPVMRGTPPRFRAFAMSSTTNMPDLVVKAVGPDGREVRVSLPLHKSPTYGRKPDGTYGIVDGDDPETVEPDSTVMSDIVSVSLGDDVTDYVQLWVENVDTGDIYQVADYHPDVKAPRFRKYFLAGVRGPVEVLAETRAEPLPLVREDDILPFDDVAPIKYMIMYDWKMESSEIDVANKYMQQAVQWLKSQETTKDTMQTTIILNQQYGGSLGEISEYAAMV